MSFTREDHAFMAEALRLASRGLTTADPNPRVGCVLVRNGEVVGRGWHQRAGEAHAEVFALSEAGVRARGATAYVTLEPCAHQGRTPPCADALIEAGIAEAVVAMTDPHPEVAGRGIERLNRAGIRVRSGLMEAGARALNAGFVSRHERARPWVRLKLACSLDGRTAAADGRSQWITGPAAREDVQRWRARASALLTGIGTVIADDPRLTVRTAAQPRQPLRVVVDSRFRMSPDARMLTLPGPVLVAGCGEPSSLPGAECLRLPDDGAGRVDLGALLGELARRGVNELHVEAGPVLAGALLAGGRVDELLVYQAPVLLGDRGHPLFTLPGLEKLSDRHNLTLVEMRRVGADTRATYRPGGA